MRKLFKYQTDSGDSTSPEEWVDECYLGTHTPLTGTRKRFNQILSGTGEWGNGWAGTQPNLDENNPDDVDTFIGEMSKYYNYYVDEFNYLGEHHPNPWDIAWTPLVKGELIRYTANISAASRDYDALGVNGPVDSPDSTNLSLLENTEDAASPVAIFTSSNRHFFCDGMRVNMRNFDGDFAYLQQDDQGTECVYYVQAITAYTFKLFYDEALTSPVQILKLPRDQYDYNFRFTQPDEPVIIRFNEAKYKDGTDYDFLTNGTSALCRWEDFDDPRSIATIPPQRDYWVDKAREGNPDTLDANEYYLHKVNPLLHTPLLPTDLIEPTVGYAYTKYFTSWQDKTNRYGEVIDSKYSLFWDRGNAFISDSNITDNDTARDTQTIWSEELFDPSTAIEYGNRFTLWTSKTKGNISVDQTSESLTEPVGELFITDADPAKNLDMLAGDYAYAISVDEASEYFTSDITFTNKLVLGGKKDQHFFVAVEDWNEDDSSPVVGSFFGSDQADTTNNRIYSIGDKGFPVIAMNYAPHEDLVLFLHDNDIEDLFRFTDTPVVELALPWPELAHYATRGDNGDFLEDYNEVPYYYAARVDQSWLGQTRYGDLKETSKHYDSGVETKHTAIKLYKDETKAQPVVCDINYVPVSIALPIQNIWIDPDNSTDLWVELHSLPAPHIVGDATRRQQSVDEQWQWPVAEEFGDFEDDSTGALPQEFRLFQGSMVSFAGCEDIDWVEGDGWFRNKSGLVNQQLSWTGDNGGWKWSRLNGKKFRAGKLSEELGELTNGGYDWRLVPGEDENGNPIQRVIVRIREGYQDDWAPGKNFKHMLYEQGDYPTDYFSPLESSNLYPIEPTLNQFGGLDDSPLPLPMNLSSEGFSPYSGEDYTTVNPPRDNRVGFWNHFFYNMTEYHNDQNADSSAIGSPPYTGVDSSVEDYVRATNPDGSLKNIGAYMLVEWGYYTTDPANVSSDAPFITTRTDAGFTNNLVPAEQTPQDEVEFPALSNNGDPNTPLTYFLADDSGEFHNHYLHRIEVSDEPQSAADASFSRGCSIFMNHFPKDTNDGGATNNGWQTYNPYSSTLFNATSVEYFPHAFTFEDVVLDIYDEDAAEATTGLVRATDDSENPIRLDIENLEFLVPGNKRYRYIDWDAGAVNGRDSETPDWTYPSSVPVINGHWWEPGSTTENVVMRDPITQSRSAYHQSGLGDTHNGWGHRVFPYTDTESVFNPAPPTGPAEIPFGFNFALDANSIITGSISENLDDLGCNNVGRFQAHREGQEVLLHPYTPPDIGTQPGPTNEDKILAEESFDMAAPWLDTDDNPSEERYWPRSEEGKCMTPSSAKIIIDQPASTSVSQSGVKYVRSAGYTQWRLELKYPPMLQEEWEPFNAAIHKARGEMRSFRLSLRHYKGFNWLFGTQGYFENRLHHQGAGYNKEYYENVKHNNYDDTTGSLKHTRYVQILEDVMPGDDVIRTVGWPSHTSALPEGSLVGGLGGRNGGVNTIVSKNQSNIWGECDFRVAYPLQATYQSGYDMNTPILQKGDYWSPEPDWLRVSLDEDSIDFDVNLISRFGFTMKFRLDDVK